MRHIGSSVILFSLASSSMWAAADPQLLSLLMPDAKVIGGVDLAQAKASPFGQFLLSQAAPAAEFDKLKAATGFDPRTDLTEVVSAALGPSGVLLAGHGAFQPTRLVNLATTAGAPMENYRGIMLVGGGNTAAAPAQDTAVAFLDAYTVLIGTRGLVKDAVDRWVGATHSSSALAIRAAQVSTSWQAWAVAGGLSGLAGQRAANTPPEAQMVQNVLAKIGDVSGGMNFGDTIVVHGTALTASAQDAQALVDVFRFMAAMAAPKTPLPAMPEVTANGSAVNLTVSLTEQQAEQLFHPVKQ